RTAGRPVRAPSAGADVDRRLRVGAVGADGLRGGRDRGRLEATRGQALDDLVLRGDGQVVVGREQELDLVLTGLVAGLLEELLRLRRVGLDALVAERVVLDAASGAGRQDRGTGNAGHALDLTAGLPGRAVRVRPADGLADLEVLDLRHVEEPHVGARRGAADQAGLVGRDLAVRRRGDVVVGQGRLRGAVVVDDDVLELRGVLAEL